MRVYQKRESKYENKENYNELCGTGLVWAHGF